MPDWRRRWIVPMAALAALAFLCLAGAQLAETVENWSFVTGRAYIRTAEVLSVAGWALLVVSALAAAFGRWSSAAGLAAAGFVSTAAADVISDIRFFPAAASARVHHVLSPTGWLVLAAAVIVGRWRHFGAPGRPFDGRAGRTPGV